MEKFRKKKLPNIKLRYNVITVLIYIIGSVLLIQLFNLQIVNGSSYRETSNARLTRESTLYAARGSILDRNGSLLAGEEMTFALELYKTKLENNVLNECILRTINTLEENGDKYTDTFPITVNPFSYTHSSEERINSWLTANNLKPGTTAENAFYYFKDKYDIEEEDIVNVRKILAVRYRISSEGYSATKSLTISNNISRKSALVFDEQSDKYPGIDVVTNSRRYYPNGTVASHILGYISSIKDEEYKQYKNDGYTINDLYGREGIEYVFEHYLKGKNGIKQIDMSVDGGTVGEYIQEEAVSGSNVVLTIDANLQTIAEKALEDTIKNSKSIDERAEGADAGAIVAMNVKTGEVLAMASYPYYDPGSWVGGRIDTDTWNMYNSEVGKPLMNRTIAGVYEPRFYF